MTSGGGVILLQLPLISVVVNAATFLVTCGIALTLHRRGRRDRSRDGDDEGR